MCSWRGGRTCFRHHILGGATCPLGFSDSLQSAALSQEGANPLGP